MKFQCLHCGYVANYDMRLGLHKMLRGQKKFLAFCGKTGKNVFMVKVKGTGFLKGAKK